MIYDWLHALARADWLHALARLLPDWFWIAFLAVGFGACIKGVWDGIRNPVEYPPDVDTREDREDKS